MKTFKQHITELWDKPLPYKLVNREKHPRFPDQGWLYEYKFEIKSTPFDVTFSNQLENDPPYWDVSFVDDEGNVYPDIDVPEATPSGRTLKWAVNTYENIEFDPKTRLGVEGETLTQEFEAHKVVEDSLWNVYNQLYE